MNRPKFCVTKVTKGTRERLLTPSVTALVKNVIQMNNLLKVWSLTQVPIFYLSTIEDQCKKYFYKHTIKVCIACFNSWEALEGRLLRGTRDLGLPWRNSRGHPDKGLLIGLLDKLKMSHKNQTEKIGSG